MNRETIKINGKKFVKDDEFLVKFKAQNHAGKLRDKGISARVIRRSANSKHPEKWIVYIRYFS